MVSRLVSPRLALWVSGLFFVSSVFLESASWGVIFPYQERDQFISHLRQTLNSHQSEMMTLLTQVESIHAAKFEFEQTVRTLARFSIEQEEYLSSVSRLQQISVHLSDKSPLYSLVYHAIVPATVSAHVHILTSGKSIHKAVLSLIQKLMPEYDWSYLQIDGDLTGLPSDVTIFSGGSKNEEFFESDALKQLRAQVQKDSKNPKRSLFLKFGCGVSPLIVSDHAKMNLATAIAGLRKAIQIQNGQACQVYQVIGVQDGIKSRFLEKLSQMSESLVFGVDYLPVAQEEFEAYSKFLDRYRSYLVYSDGNAPRIEQASGRVDPHFFYFPNSDFKRFDFNHLKDLNKLGVTAPFYILFGYENPQGLQAVLSRPELSQFAAAASFYGNKAEKEVRAQRGVLEGTHFKTVSNKSLLDDVDGNEPYGSYGSQSNQAMLLEYRPESSQSSSTSDVGALSYENFFYPLLFSREIKRFFSEVGASSGLKVRSSAHSLEGQTRSISDVVREDFESKYRNPDFIKSFTRYDIDRINGLFLQDRSHGIAALQEIIRRDGLTRMTVDLTRYESEEKTKQLEALYGTRILYDGNLWEAQLDARKKNGEISQHVKGVLLHSPSSGTDSVVFNLARGDVDPQLGSGVFVWLIRDRVYEHHILNSVWPGIVAPGASFSELDQEMIFPDVLKVNRLKARKLVDELIKDPLWMKETKKDEIERCLTLALSEFFGAVSRRFPKGAFVKNYGEFGTGDSKIQLTTFDTKVESIVQEFMSSLEDYLNSASEVAASSFPIPYRQFELRRLGDASAHHFFQHDIDKHKTGSKFIFQFLVDPDRILLNQKLKIAKTPLGANVEIRVDYIDGEPINTVAHFTSEYLGDEEEEAKEVMRQFFKKAGGLFNYISGGADVAKLESGEWAIIEMNVGGTSGSTIPTLLPITANILVSRLQATPTYLISHLESQFQEGPSAMNAFLKGLKFEKMKTRHESLDDLSVEEVSRWIRDRYLEKFKADVNRNQYDLTIESLNTTFSGIGSEHDTGIPALLKGAKDYMRSRLGLNKVSI